MKRANFLITIFIGFILVGCFATYQQAAAPSVKPEININTIDRAKIKSAIIDRYMNQNYSIVSESDYSIVFSTQEEKFGNAAYQALTGDYNSTSRVNIRINMATFNNYTRVLAQANFIIKNSNGREDVKDVTNDFATLLQKDLQAVKTKVEMQ